MKFCSKCGKEIMDDAVICPGCGCSQGSAAQDSDSFGWALLGFCFPLIGLILYLIWNNTAPMKAKKAGKGALVSVIVSVALYIIYFVVIAGIIASNT